MSFAKSKNDFSKKDMNFFSEFSSGASQQISSLFPVFLLLTVLILGITLVIWIVCGIQIMKKQDKIDDIRAEMASEEYQTRLGQKDQSQIEVEDLRQYYYVLSTLDSRVTGKTISSVETLKACKNALPDDAVLKSYHDEDGIVEVSGIALSRESCFNYGKTLDDTGIFSFMQETVSTADPIASGYDKDTLMFGVVQYEFSYRCTISGSFTLSYARFVDGTSPTPLTQLITKSYQTGEEYSIQGVSTFELDGVSYTLTNVKINDTAVDADKLNEIIAADAFAGKMGENLNVEFLYTSTSEDDTNGGES